MKLHVLGRAMAALREYPGAVVERVALDSSARIEFLLVGPRAPGASLVVRKAVARAKSEDGQWSVEERYRGHGGVAMWIAWTPTITLGLAAAGDGPVKFTLVRGPARLPPDAAVGALATQLRAAREEHL
jgi:hypothetical protein